MVAPATSDRIRVIIIDDHPVALAGIRVGLKRFPDIHLEAEALDGATGLQQIETLQPDVAVIDVHLPDMDGLEVTARARAVSPETRIIITSGDLSVATMSRANQLGVAGSFHKSGAVERLALLIRSVYAAGDEEDDAELPAAPPELAHGLDSLTLREHEILTLLANGLSLKQSAGRLGISVQIAENLKESVMRKLNVRDRVELVHFALQESLVHDPM